MPSHLAPPTTAPSSGGKGGGATRGNDPELPTRRALRRHQGGTGLAPRWPVVPPVAVVLPDAAVLLAADEELAGADVVSPRSGRRRAHRAPADLGSPAAGPDAAPRTSGAPSSTGAPVPAAAAVPTTRPVTTPAAMVAPPATPSCGPPAPTTRREARALAGTLAAPSSWDRAPGGPTAPSGWRAPGGDLSHGADPSPAQERSVGGVATALAEREPEMSVPLHFTAELELNGLLHRPEVQESAPPGTAGSSGEPLDEPTVIELPDTPVVGLSRVALPVTQDSAAPAAPALPSRRARREVEMLEQALALPAAGADDERDDHLRAVAFSPASSADDAAHPRSGGRSAFGLPQAGMVGVLGLAALVGPTVGQVAHAGTSPTTTTVPASSTTAPTPISAVADLPVPPSAGSPAVVTPGVDADGAPDAETLLAKREAAEQASRAIGERALAAEAEAEEAAEREALVATLVPECSGEVSPAAMTNGNGLLDAADLCELWDGSHQLRPDAALDLARLDLAFRETFGEDITISDAYRTYGSQVAVRAEKPALAARPGTSLHGWGIAVDLGGGISDGGERYRWLMEHAGEYGWENPAWARPGGGGPHEPWHWEYAAGRGGPSTTTDARS